MSIGSADALRERHADLPLALESAGVQGILNSADGKPVWVDCDPANGQCTVQASAFFIFYMAVFKGDCL